MSPARPTAHALGLVAILALCAPAQAARPSAAVRAGAEATERGAAPATARERQRRCAAEWRRLSPADRVERGPTWPTFYSRCVKRLKLRQTEPGT